MKLEKIKYKDLNSRAKETYNFQKVSALLVEYGFATNWLNVDFESADFIAVHFNGLDILKVQLKGRVNIDKKYQEKDIWMSFPVDDDFYLVPHDELIEIAKRTTGWIESDSWKIHGGYSAGKPSVKMLKALQNYKL
ncbi:hypothetical protein [Halobacteriovorax sp. DA5]|uniref:hypothetical protein n=1 Tax=Halobacteriovorax sp. DA5 TaxID=2067553 RepID=UPI000CD2EA40|nr:hypothetical protein [Halobacteriovorax sp. DA5]POB13629.1 hypothetical protein C0Z22_10720 [Halobacteriovorax sp. DA5]